MNYRKNVKIGHEFEMFGYGFICGTPGYGQRQSE